MQRERRRGRTRPSNQRTGGSVQTSWPTLSRYVSAYSAPLAALVVASISFACTISPSK